MRVDSRRRTDGRWRLTAARLVAIVVAVCLAAACSDRPQPLPRLATDDRILAFGDSLTYGTGASPDESYPSRLAVLTGREVVNAGVPGEVSEQGLARLPDALDEHRPRLVILCLGGNDMLRRVAPDRIAANLRAMVRMARDRGAAVVLLAVPKPALFAGTAAFYEEVADELDVPLEADVLRKVLFDNALKSDPIHPNAEGYDRIAQALAALLRDAGAL